MKLLLKTKRINTPGVIDFEPILDAGGDYAVLRMLELTIFNPTQYNVKINGLTIPPKKSFNLNFMYDYYQYNFGGYGFMPSYLPAITLDLPNKGGAVDVMVYFCNPNSTIELR